MSSARARWAVVLVVVLGAVTPVGAATGAVRELPASVPDERSLGPLAATAEAADSCFGPGGHRFEIGTEGPRIYLTLHLSLVTAPLSDGSLGVELVGVALEYPVVTLATGVRHRLPAESSNLLSSPFEGFTYVFDYHLRLPMFASLGESDYESDPPVSGPVSGTACGG
jgi:hypothetical protein